MRRWRTAVAATIATATLGLGAPAAMAATADPVPPTDYCEARDGAVVLQQGTAQCWAEAGEGNVAIAKGANSAAYVGDGVNNKAYADGDGSCAIVFGPTDAPVATDVVCTVSGPPTELGVASGGSGYDNNVATAKGPGNLALVYLSRNGRAKAEGSPSIAIAGGGIGNKAHAEGFQSCAIAGDLDSALGSILSGITSTCVGGTKSPAIGGGVSTAVALQSDDNEAHAGGDGGFAIAAMGNGNSAHADGSPSVAVATYGNDNTADVTGDCSGAAAGSLGFADYLLGTIGFVGCGDAAPPAVASAPATSSSPSDTCYVDEALGGDDNTAKVTGDGSLAFAGAGCGNSATAKGSPSFAIAGFGLDNKATASNYCSVAMAGLPVPYFGGPFLGSCTFAAPPAVGSPAVQSDGGSGSCVIDAYPFLGYGNTATASGATSIAMAAIGCNNRATASGPGSVAYAAEGINNQATASGAGSGAFAGDGINNQAVASGVDGVAYAAGGNNNVARATKSGSCALAGDPTSGPPCAPCGPVAGPSIAACSPTVTGSPGLSPGSDYNLAVASGVDSIAVAGIGDRNRATASAAGSSAFAGEGDRNRARAATVSCTTTATGTNQSTSC